MPSELQTLGERYQSLPRRAQDFELHMKTVPKVDVATLVGFRGADILQARWHYQVVTLRNIFSNGVRFHNQFLHLALRNRWARTSSRPLHPVAVRLQCTFEQQRPECFGFTQSGPVCM